MVRSKQARILFDLLQWKTRILTILDPHIVHLGL